MDEMYEEHVAAILTAAVIQKMGSPEHDEEDLISMVAQVIELYKLMLRQVKFSSRLGGSNAGR